MDYGSTELAMHLHNTKSIHNIPYSPKYWRELKLAVELKVAIARILEFGGIAIRIYTSGKFWQILIWRL